MFRLCFRSIAVLFFIGWETFSCEYSTHDDVVLRPVTSNEEFIDWLRSENILKKDRIEYIMRKVDILNYVPSDSHFYLLDIQTDAKYGAFMETPSLIQTYLSLIEPHMKFDARILEVGSGTGYLTHLIAELMNGTGQIIGVEHVPELVNASIQNILYSNPDLLLNGQIKFVVADGRRGYSKKSPYDVILMSASTPHLSSSIVDQLKPGGRIILSLGAPDGVHSLCTLDKFENGTLQKTVHERGSYGHLQAREQQMGGWTNGTLYGESFGKQKFDLKKLFAELGRGEILIEPKDRIKDMFENAKEAKVEKSLESYERDIKKYELFEDKTSPQIPYALEEIKHEFRTLRTKRTRKTKLTSTSTEPIILWRK